MAIIDTAGRLQTHQNLMQELGKIHRVIGKRLPGAPHESLLVLDATTGQNGLSQASKFSEAASCTGIIHAKLDGTAKGGVVVAIRQQMGIPVKYVGVGEQIGDLELFSPADQTLVQGIDDTLQALVAEGPAAFGPNDVGTLLGAAIQTVEALRRVPCQKF